MQLVRGVALAALAGVVGAGCPSVGAYVCSDDTDCDRAQLQGVCLSDDVCAYEDMSGTCPSGWVRSPNAEVSPGECVPLGGSDDVADDDGDSTDTGGASAGFTSGPGTCGGRALITVNTGMLSPLSPVVGYPLYVVIDDPELVAAIATSGENIWITDDEGTALPTEWEQAGATEGRLGVWVRLPSHTLKAVVPLELHWGAVAPASDPALVWDAFVGVWHFDTTPNATDQQPMPNSANADVPGRMFGTIEADQGVPGMLGGSLRFDGIDDVVEVSAPWVGSLTSFTVTMWARYEGESDKQDSYFQRLNGDAFYPRVWRSSDGILTHQYRTDLGITPMFTDVTHPVGEWLHLVVQRDAPTNETRVFIDGELAVTHVEEAGAVLETGDNPFEIGSGEWGSFPGTIDEVRVATQAIPAAWMMADANHQPDPTRAVTVGSAEPSPCD